MMEKPKKERRFIKTLGKIGEILIQEVLLKVGSNLIKRIGGKKTLPSILILFLSISLFAQYPNTGNKQRLGFQTTADGLVWRGSISDTASIQPVSNQNAWVILDTVNLKIYSFDFSSNVWNQVGTGGGSAFTQPVDSLFFNVSVPTNNVDTAKMRWDSDLATVVLGLNDNVPNEIGFKNFWLVKNQTGATITKGSLVYANGTVGASGRITVAKFIANGTIDAKYLLGITAHDLSNGEDGYVISFGKIRQVNTDTFSAGAILYPSPTVAGVWTDVEPVAPNLDMPIGFCINSHVNNGTIAIRVASGYSLNELHDVQIISPVDRASLYYSGGLWRDTTPTLLVSDTASMLTNYLRSGVASNTYLPLTGGTLTGALNGTTGKFTTNLGVGNTIAGSPILFTSGDGNQEVHFAHSQNIAGATVTLRLTNNNAGLFDQGAYFQGIVNRGINEMSGALGTNGSEYIRLRGVDDGGIVGVGIFNTNPSYNLDLTGTFRATGNSLIGGTFGVTGATTLSGALTVNNATVLNEGSGDFDTRIESNGNANMVFVDAGLDRVGIGTGTPSKTLDVNGELKIATVTATPTALLGKDASNVVGEVTTVAQTGLMTRGALEASTSSVEGTFSVTHGLGATPVSIIITSAGLESSFERKLLFEVYARNSTTFSVQAWNLDGTAATSKTVKIYWLAIK
jgi:hypothetical protein